MAEPTKTLSERCAAALGIETSPDLHEWDEGRDGNRQCTNCLALIGWEEPAPEMCCPPFGEDTPEGWACTGLLMQRFGLSVVKSPRTGRYACGDQEAGSGGQGRVAGDFAGPCAAVAEWVAEHGREASHA